MLLGLHESDSINCHGLKITSAVSALQLNPVDQVFRMAADMSRCFTSLRSLVVEPSHSRVLISASSSAAEPCAGGGLSVTLDPHHLEQRKRMRDIGLSDDDAVRQTCLRS
jgi:hypothetical protein